jgi:hypothetical protein
MLTNTQTFINNNISCDTRKIRLIFLQRYPMNKPNTAAALSKEWRVFSRLNAWGGGGSGVHTRHGYLCVVRGLATDWSPIKEFYRLCIRSRNWKSGQGPMKDCKANYYYYYYYMDINSMNRFSYLIYLHHFFLYSNLVISITMHYASETMHGRTVGRFLNCELALRGNLLQLSQGAPQKFSWRGWRKIKEQGSLDDIFLVEIRIQYFLNISLKQSQSLIMYAVIIIIIISVVVVVVVVECQIVSTFRLIWKWIKLSLWGSVVGWGTVLQTKRSRVRVPMRLFVFLIYLILPTALWP